MNNKEPLDYKQFNIKCPEVFILLDRSLIKYTTKSYGWSDDTLLMYKEEVGKHMFYMCKNKGGVVPHERRFIYYIKPDTFKSYFELNNSTIKIKLTDSRIIKYKDIYLEDTLKHKEIKETKMQLNNAIKEVDVLLEKLTESI